jgi:hypothetical protein
MINIAKQTTPSCPRRKRMRFPGVSELQYNGRHPGFHGTLKNFWRNTRCNHRRPLLRLIRAAGVNGTRNRLWRSESLHSRMRRSIVFYEACNSPSGAAAARASVCSADSEVGILCETDLNRSHSAWEKDLMFGFRNVRRKKEPENLLQISHFRNVEHVIVI